MTSFVCGIILIVAHFGKFYVPLNIIGGILLGSGAVDIGRWMANL